MKTESRGRQLLRNFGGQALALLTRERRERRRFTALSEQALRFNEEMIEGYLSLVGRRNGERLPDTLAKKMVESASRVTQACLVAACVGEGAVATGFFEKMFDVQLARLRARTAYGEADPESKKLTKKQEGIINAKFRFLRMSEEDKAATFAIIKKPYHELTKADGDRLIAYLSEMEKAAEVKSEVADR